MGLHIQTPTIDLAIMPIAPLINEAISKGFTPFFRTLNKSLIPTDEQLKGLTTVEDIVMVGYRQEFLIDTTITRFLGRYYSYASCK